MRIRTLIDFTMNSSNILTSVRISCLDQADCLALVPLTLRGEEKMNVGMAEMVDTDVPR